MRAKGIKQGSEKRKRGRQKTARPMKRVNICIDPVDYEAVEKLATANGMPSAMLIRFGGEGFIGPSSQRKAVCDVVRG